jgi:RNA polymerase sigma factor (sigma-70 family)
LRKRDDPTEWARCEPDETWRRLAGIAFRMARRMTGSTEDAQDVAQATLAAYGLAAGVLDNAEAWVTTVATRASLSLLRRRDWETPVDPTTMTEAAERSQARNRDQTDGIVAALLCEELLSLLPEQQRQVLLLKYGLGLERATIADLLGVAEETVKTHLRRGMKRLRNAPLEGGP